MQDIALLLKPRHRPIHRPEFEALESRILPSIAVAACPLAGLGDAPPPVEYDVRTTRVDRSTT